MTQPARHSRVGAGLALSAALLVGAGLAAQARLNGELTARVGDGLVATTLSYGSALVVLLVALAVWPSGRRGLADVARAVRERRFPPQYLLGGVAGAFFVVTQGITVGLLGVSLFTVATVAGQTVGSLLVDRWGIGPAGRILVSKGRLVAAVLALSAVVVAVSAGVGAPSSTGVASAGAWMLALPLIAGAGIGWQQAVNGRVRVEASSVLAATVVNFAAGALALVVVTTVRIASVGLPDTVPTELWLYIGGAMGCVFTAVNTLVVRVTGVLVLTLATVAGQLTAAVALDILLPATGRTVSPFTVAGSAIALAAVVVASLTMRGSAAPSRRRPTATGSR